MKSLLIYFIVILTLFSGQLKESKAQQKSPIKQLSKLTCPEKMWVLAHPFIASKAWKITRFVLQVTDSVRTSGLLDGDPDGGQVDAFRHAFWMAVLSHNIQLKKAYKLGVAHEKGNYLEYKNNKIEEKTSPDKISSDMDFWNNKKGLEIGIINKTVSYYELKALVLEALLKGELKIIRKTLKGNFLDCNGQLITTESLKGLWINNKCLVPSNTRRKR